MDQCNDSLRQRTPRRPPGGRPPEQPYWTRDPDAPGAGYLYDHRDGFDEVHLFFVPGGWVEVTPHYHHGYRNRARLAARVHELVELLHAHPELVDELVSGPVQVAWRKQIPA